MAQKIRIFYDRVIFFTKYYIKILKWAENILSRNKLAGKKNATSKQVLKYRYTVDLPSFEHVATLF